MVPPSVCCRGGAPWPPWELLAGTGLDLEEEEFPKETSCPGQRTPEEASQWPTWWGSFSCDTREREQGPSRIWRGVLC